MAFTYYIKDTSDISSMMRLELGDNVEDDGILPGQANFQDAELDYFYDAEGDDFWPAVARAFEAAAARWAPFPTYIKMGTESQSISAAEFYTKKAQDARTRSRPPASITLTKADYGMDTS